jgi:CRP/FNR family transcriptional regulator
MSELISHQTITQLFPQLNDSRLIEEIKQKGRIVQMDAGEVLIREGQNMRNIPFVLSGLVKILRHDENGQKLFMYYLEPGDSCAMTMICCMGMQTSSIEALTEEPSTLLQLPIDAMDDWMQHYPSWRAFVMNTFAVRFEEMLSTIDTIAFRRLDERLEHYLLTQKEAKGTPVLNITNQQIADELATSREVISRLLGRMAQEGMVKLSRSQITVLF